MSDPALQAPRILAVAGIASIALAVQRVEVLWLVGGWALGVLAVAAAWTRLGRGGRVVLSAALLPALVALTFEGGLFLLPAAGWLLVVALREAPRGRAAAG